MNKVRLYYRMLGSGEPLVALHGLYASSDTWMGVAPSLAKLYTLILPDLRNHGRSPHSGDLSYTSMCNDVINLMDRLSIDKAVVMGHSMGGKLAMQLAASHPERVRRLVVEDISPLSYNHNTALLNFHKHTISALQSVDLSALATRKEAEKKLSSLLADGKLCSFLLKNLSRTPEGRYLWKINLPVIADNLQHIMSAIQIKTAVHIPSLFIKSELSSYIQDEDELAIKQLFTDYQIIKVPKTDHWVHNSQKEYFISVVKSYLQS